jgi:predicted transcriptional regulator
LAGVITHGDVVRAMQANNVERAMHMQASDIMTSTPMTISETKMFTDAERLMSESGVTCLVAIDRSGLPSGIVKVFDFEA